MINSKVIYYSIGVARRPKKCIDELCYHEVGKSYIVHEDAIMDGIK